MLVPETAVYEDYFAARSEDEVRLSRQLFPMQAIPVA
jgi:hypothetical protein